MLGTYRKRLLPNYAVFDEARYFTPGNETDPLELYVIGGVKVGISICEDIWSPDGPLAVQADGGAELAININASPYHRGKAAYRERMLATRAADAHSALVYVNQVGGQDELVFDGCSLAFDAEGNAARPGPAVPSRTCSSSTSRCPPCTASACSTPGAGSRRCRCRTIVVTEAPVAHETPLDNPLVDHLAPEAELYEALVLGTRDYCAKNGFTDVVIGLSGGIDSTIVAVIAADALGAEHVHGVSMPSRYSSDGSKSDAARARRQPRHRLPHDRHRAGVPGLPRDARAELRRSAPGADAGERRSRCRGQLLMALSNEFGWMVLTTGNKSEMAVGYWVSMPSGSNSFSRA